MFSFRHKCLPILTNIVFVPPDVCCCWCLWSHRLLIASIRVVPCGHLSNNESSFILIRRSLQSLNLILVSWRLVLKAKFLREICSHTRSVEEIWAKLAFMAPVMVLWSPDPWKQRLLKGKFRLYIWCKYFVPTAAYLCQHIYKHYKIIQNEAEKHNLEM